jgi:hypothetical protein
MQQSDADDQSEKPAKFGMVKVKSQHGSHRVPSAGIDNLANRAICIPSIIPTKATAIKSDHRHSGMLHETCRRRELESMLRSREFVHKYGPEERSDHFVGAR